MLQLSHEYICKKFKELYYSNKINIYTLKCTHYKYNCNQPCLSSLASCTLVACDNYITTKVNVAPNH